MRTLTKKTSLSSLITELDKLVSEVVRRSAADDKGMITCISCGKRVRWQDADCCHYIDRRNNATRFNLLNLAAGCQYCNRHDEDIHKVLWAKKMDPRLIEYLESEGRSMRKLFRHELEEGVRLMKLKLNQLR